jgi:hypothetical protein
MFHYTLRTLLIVMAVLWALWAVYAALMVRLTHRHHVPFRDRQASKNGVGAVACQLRPLSELYRELTEAEARLACEVSDAP